MTLNILAIGRVKYLHFFLCSFSDAPKVEMKRNLPLDEDVIVPIIKWGRSTISGFELARMPGVVQFYRYSRGCKP